MRIEITRATSPKRPLTPSSTPPTPPSQAGAAWTAPSIVPPARAELRAACAGSEAASREMPRPHPASLCRPDGSFTRWGRYGAVASHDERPGTHVLLPALPGGCRRAVRSQRGVSSHLDRGVRLPTQGRSPRQPWRPCARPAPASNWYDSSRLMTKPWSFTTPRSANRSHGGDHDSASQDLGHHRGPDSLWSPVRGYLQDVPARLNQVADAQPVSNKTSVQAVELLAHPFDRELQLRYGSIDTVAMTTYLDRVLPYGIRKSEPIP